MSDQTKQAAESLRKSLWPGKHAAEQNYSLILEALAAAYQRGASDMRERCAVIAVNLKEQASAMSKRAEDDNEALHHDMAGAAAARIEHEIRALPLGAKP